MKHKKLIEIPSYYIDTLNTTVLGHYTVLHFDFTILEVTAEAADNLSQQ
jgi:hypothetical protein